MSLINKDLSRARDLEKHDGNCRARRPSGLGPSAQDSLSGPEKTWSHMHARSFWDLLIPLGTSF